MKKIITSLFILASLNGIGQTYTMATFVTKYKKDSAVQSQKNIATDNRIKLVENSIAIILKDIDALKKDSMFFSKDFAVVNGIVSLAGSGGNIPQKWIDSVTNILGLHLIDIKQLYSNDVSETKARTDGDLVNSKATADTGKALRVSLKITDDLGILTNGAVRTNSRNITAANLRIDDINNTTISISNKVEILNASVTKLESAAVITDEQLRLTSEKIEAMRLTIPKGINSQLTY